MEVQSLSPEELEQELKQVRKDWSAVYLQLNEQGNVVFPEMPNGLKNAIYNHYRRTRVKAKIQTMKDGRVLVYLDNP